MHHRHLSFAVLSALVSACADGSRSDEALQTSASSTNPGLGVGVSPTFPMGTVSLPVPSGSHDGSMATGGAPNTVQPGRGGSSGTDGTAAAAGTNPIQPPAGSAGSSLGDGGNDSTGGKAGSSGGAGSPDPTGNGGTGGNDETGGTGGAIGGAGAGGIGEGGTGGEEVPCVVDHGGQTPSLREKYTNHFSIGAAIDNEYSRYTGVLTTHFSSVTAENEMKFDALQPSEGNFTYDTADQMVDFANNNGMQVRGHALVWHRQTPSWVFSGSSDQVLQRMRDHIRNVMQHYQGKVYAWDVVNEAIMTDGTYRTENEEGADQSSGWYGALGESYIAEAFLAAREADPTAKLFYNDFHNYHPVRRQAIYEMLSGLLDDGVPIDGVGLQCHINIEPGTDPEEQSYHQTVENLEEAILMYSSLGLEVQITELDLSVYIRSVTYTEDTFYTPETFTPEVQEQQAERYREFFELFRRYSDVITNVTFWGVADDNTWLSEFSSGRQDFPLLFDAEQQPKPAFWSVVDFCE